MDIISQHRYHLQKLISYDTNSKLEVWKETELSSDKIESLEPFLVKGYRIFDTDLNQIVLVSNNLDLFHP
ncbi:hypothetical protein D3C87_624380 [compost metagenome]